MWRFRILVLMAVILTPMMGLGQFTLKGKFTPVDEFDWVLVYKVSPSNYSYIGDGKVNSSGEFKFELDASQTAGMYRLVYAVPQEEYSFDIICNAKEDVEFTFDINKGITFQSSTENTMMSSYNNSMGMISQSIGNFFRRQSTDTSALLNILKTQRETQAEFERISDGMIAHNFIVANRPYIPDGYEDLNTYFSNIKAHYFDHVDFNNEILLSSSFLVDRCLNYVFGMVARQGDITANYKFNIDQVANAMGSANTRTKKMLMHVLWQQLAEAKYEAVANYIADNYLISLAKELGENELAVELERFRNVSLGMTAPNFEIPLNVSSNNKSVSLHDYDVADQYIVVFWSSSCTHCLEELPRLHDLVSGFDQKKLKVIAFGLEDDKAAWQRETMNYPLFTHVAGLGKWENEVGVNYNVSTTPTYFILDRNKTIVAKPLNFEELQKQFTSQK